MEESAFRECVKRLQEVDEVIKKLDPAIRHDAFLLLAKYVEKKSASAGESVNEDKASNTVVDPTQFLAKFAHDKPSDNVKLIAACFYSQFGKAPFTVHEVKSTAEEAGLTIPDDPAATLRMSTKEKKKLFRKTSSGAFAPTVHGEKFFKETYEVTKGTRKKPVKETV